MGKGDRKILKADPEDGTTQIANLLLEALAMAHLSGEEKGAVIFLWRRTYGWADGDRRKTENEISLPEWAAALDTSKDYSARVIRNLVQKRVIIQKDLGKGKGYIYSMNTRVNQWDNSSLNSQQLSERYSQGLSKKYRPLSTKRSTPSDTDLALPKEILNKDIKKDDDPNLSFEEYKEQLKREFSDLDIEEEYRKFELWWSEGNRKLKRPKLAFRNWLNKAREIKKERDDGTHRERAGKLPTQYTNPDELRHELEYEE